jgi:uncharacterized protein YmfQ (DUF2313 family)
MLQVQLVKLKKQDDEHRIIQSSQQVNYETCSSRIHAFLDKYELIFDTELEETIHVYKAAYKAFFFKRKE